MKKPMKRRFSFLSVKTQLISERGFAFPVTLCILILFTALLSFQAVQFVVQKEFYYEIEQFEKHQLLFLMALKETEGYLSQTGEDFEETGRFVFRDGTVSYVIKDWADGYLQISYSLAVPGRIAVEGTAYYSVEDKKIVSWYEKG